MLKADLSLIGIIDFIVLTVCMLDAWKFKTLHDSTFEAQDVVHKLVDVLYATTAAGACVRACVCFFLYALNYSYLARVLTFYRVQVPLFSFVLERSLKTFEAGTPLA